MAWVKRIGLFFVVNILIMVTVGIVWSILGQYFGISGYTAYLVVFSGVAGFGGALFSLWTSKWMAKTFYGVQIIDPRTPDSRLRSLVEKVHSLARMAQLPQMPEVGVYESPDINAFATGPSKSKSLVAVSSGLLYNMEAKEIEGVLAHEISHIANGDMVTMTLIQGIVNTFSLLFSRLLANLISSQFEERSRFMVYFVCTIIGDILFTLLGSIVVSYFSRTREFRADRGGAQLSSRDSMISALRKLQLVQSRMVPSQERSKKDGLATLKISHYEKGGLAALFMTHPPLELRIQTLEKGR
jgi:heat shock protein HtpX